VSCVIASVETHNTASCVIASIVTHDVSRIIASVVTYNDVSCVIVSIVTHDVSCVITRVVTHNDVLCVIVSVVTHDDVSCVIASVETHNAKQLPYLKHLAVKYYCMPATSVSDDRFFSSAGVTVSRMQRLTRGLSENLDLMLCNKLVHLLLLRITQLSSCRLCCVDGGQQSQSRARYPGFDIAISEQYYSRMLSHSKLPSSLKVLCTERLWTACPTTWLSSWSQDVLVRPPCTLPIAVRWNSLERQNFSFLKYWDRAVHNKNVWTRL